jgi:hypothetical protein
MIACLWGCSEMQGARAVLEAVALTLAAMRGNALSAVLNGIRNASCISCRCHKDNPRCGSDLRRGGDERARLACRSDSGAQRVFFGV